MVDSLIKALSVEQVADAVFEQLLEGLDDAIVVLPFTSLLIDKFQIVVAQDGHEDGLFIAELLTFGNTLSFHLAFIHAVLLLAHILLVADYLGIVRVERRLEHIEEIEHVVQAEHSLLRRLLRNKVGRDAQLSANVDCSRRQHAIEVLTLGL